MQDHAGPIYEVTLRVERDAADGIDDWLAEHAAALLEQPGFVDAEICVLDDEPGYVTRVTRYFVASDADLEAYLAGPAASLRQETADRFGERFEGTRRVLRNGHRPDAAALAHCLNCDAVLTGQYCGHCGQRARSRLISVWELVRDALGDLIDVDSRLWLTLRELAFRPGRLTREYLLGRRARYMPPFRTYLVLSLLFFLVAFFDPRDEFGFLFEPAEPGATAAETDEAGEPPGSDAVIVTPDGEEVSPYFRVEVNEDGSMEGRCTIDDYDVSDLPPWWQRRLSKERLEEVCLRMTAADGAGLQGFLDRLVDSVPVALIILLPLMALVLKLLYPLSRRYYVEHLLLLIHFHAFVFLALTAQILLSRLGSAVNLPGGVLSVALLVVPLYIPVYFYKSLRRVYAQGHILTSLKYLLLFTVYSTGLLLILFVAAVFAAFTA